jgi:hypothetical protein
VARGQGLEREDLGYSERLSEYRSDCRWVRRIGDEPEHFMNRLDIVFSPPAVSG